MEWLLLVTTSKTKSQYTTELRISWNDIDFDLNFNITSLNNICGVLSYVSKKLVTLEQFLYLTFCIIVIRTYILKFDVLYNNIADDGAVAIGECLKNNNTLQELNMSYNKVSDSSISGALKIYITLKIHISHNIISDDGAVAISDCLTINNTLQELTLSWNSTATEGITKIAEAIAVNTCLHALDVSS